MVYVKSAPKISRLRVLADDISTYPISCLDVQELAEHKGCGDEVLGFLRLFSGRMVFVDRRDFLQKCSLLENLLYEERHSAPDYFRTEQED